MDRGLTTIKVIVVVLGLLIVAATVALVMFDFNQAGKPADQSSVHGPHWAQRPWASIPRLNAINLFIIRTFASNLNPPAALCV